MLRLAVLLLLMELLLVLRLAVLLLLMELLLVLATGATATGAAGAAGATALLGFCRNVSRYFSFNCTEFSFNCTEVLEDELLRLSNLLVK